MKKFFYGLSFVYVLYILTVECNALRYLTTWTIITQLIYFLSEFHWNKNIPTLTQNLTFTPSIFITVYWPLKYYFGWCCNEWNYIIHDLMIHCFNIVLVIIAVFISPRLEYRLVFIPVALGIGYIAFAFGYTAHHGSIYPTNFFNTTTDLLWDVGAATIVVPTIHFIGTRLAKCKTKNAYLPVSETTNDKSWCEKKCNFKILY
jgi:hypothetical protein